MRNRKVIWEQNENYFDLEKEDKSDTFGLAICQLGLQSQLQLEVLLDIRDLLIKLDKRSKGTNEK